MIPEAQQIAIAETVGRVRKSAKASYPKIHYHGGWKE